MRIEVATLKGHEDAVRCLAALPGGRLASGSADKAIKIWDLASSALVATQTGHPKTLISLVAGGRCS